MQAEMKESDPNTTGEGLNASNQLSARIFCCLVS